jgi:hypothetical protein
MAKKKTQSRRRHVLSSSSDEAEVLVTAESTLVADIPDEDDQDVLAASASDIEAADFRSPTSPPPRHDPESDNDRASSPPMAPWS